MIEPRSLFYAYRYMVTPSLPNLFTHLEFVQTGKTKEQLMYDVFDDIYNSNKTHFKLGRKRYIFFPVTKYKKQLFLLNFAKEERGKKYVEGETSIKLVDDNRLTPILLYIHSEYQILLIERKTTAFQDMRSAVKLLEWYFRDRMRQFEHTVRIYPLSNPEKFWETVESADEIYELSLTLNAPNMFGGNKDLRELIEEIKDETNNDETTLDLKSKDGNLNIKKLFWQKPIEYISKIGGKYGIVFKRDGAKQRQTNHDNIEKTQIVRHKEEQYTDEELKNVEDKMKIIDGRSTDKENNEKSK